MFSREQPAQLVTAAGRSAGHAEPRRAGLPLWTQLCRQTNYLISALTQNPASPLDFPSFLNM